MANFGIGVKALQRLFNLGYRVRAKVDNGTLNEVWVAREIQSYIRWTERDGGYDKKRYFPVLSLVAGREGLSPDRMTKKITKEMQFLAEKHREYLAIPPRQPAEAAGNGLYTRQPPLIYGILIAQSVVMLVTLDSADPNAAIKHFSHFNFREKDMDVWNALAIAFMAIMARNYTMSTLDELEDDDTPTTDEDA